MTTDITELAQSLKAAAEKATLGPWGVARDGKTLVSNQSHPIATLADAMHRMLADGSTGKDAEFIALANPANILALVEALENSESRLHEVAVTCATAEQALDKAQQRIAELESRTVKLPSLNPEMFNEDVMFGYRKAQKEAVDFCAAAGIKVEAE